MMSRMSHEFGLTYQVVSKGPMATSPSGSPCGSASHISDSGDEVGFAEVADAVVAAEAEKSSDALAACALPGAALVIVVNSEVPRPRLAMADAAAATLLSQDALVVLDGDAVGLPEVVGAVVPGEAWRALPLLEWGLGSALGADAGRASVRLTVSSGQISADPSDSEVPASRRDVDSVLAGEGGCSALLFDVSLDEFCHNIGLECLSWSHVPDGTTNQTPSSVRLVSPSRSPLVR